MNSVRDPVKKWKQNVAGTLVKQFVTHPATNCFQSQEVRFARINGHLGLYMLHKLVGTLYFTNGFRVANMAQSGFSVVSRQ